MAILLKQGTLNPSSTTLANDLRVALVGAVNDAIVAGYTKWAVVDDGYINGTTIRSVITNTDGHATMLINSTSTDNTNLLCNIFFSQSYTVATHTMNNLAWSRQSATYTSNATGFSGASYTPTNAMIAEGSQVGTGGAGGVGSSKALVATASQTNWAAMIEQDYLYFTFKDGSTNKGQWIFIGKFETLVSNPAITDTYPFAQFGKAINTNIGSNLHSLYTYNYTGVHTTSLSSFAQDTNVATLGDYDRYSSNPNKAKLSPVYIIRTNISTFGNVAFEQPSATNHTAGYLRGKLPNAYHGEPLNAVWGDTVTINSVSYFYVGGTLSTYDNQMGLLSLWVRI